MMGGWSRKGFGYDGDSMEDIMSVEEIRSRLTILRDQVRRASSAIGYWYERV